MRTPDQHALTTLDAFSAAKAKMIQHHSNQEEVDDLQSSIDVHTGHLRDDLENPDVNETTKGLIRSALWPTAAQDADSMSQGTS
mgnify:FL=1